LRNLSKRKKRSFRILRIWEKRSSRLLTKKNPAYWMKDSQRSQSCDLCKHQLAFLKNKEIE
jgi:hypothetical protein